ncbi:BTB/POZ domain-containing protein 3 isoform X1 [Lepeophtheirus salmonis]|uniref:BTB/POZ domain-containing protein 3 isoform X1 n=2 Tax=Lepeophtheirus salmonis TaxID=72036 RepID=UPI001AEA054F|nr:BTB/POZ domain-containing protein 3-like isoform X2 [Lepeophtheirus salmonis]
MLKECPKEIPAHKFILCIGSPVFETMFKGTFKESVMERVHIEIPDVEPDTFEALLAYLYLDKISLNENIVFEVLYCSKKYMLPFLTKECITYLGSIVKPHNAILFMSKTRVYDCPEFWDICWDIISDDPDLCYGAYSFFNIDFSTLNNVLSRKQLERSEIVVFDAALRWATHRLNTKGEINEEEDPGILASKKRKVLGIAFNYISFEKMSAKEIAEIVVPSSVLSSNELVNLFVNKAVIVPEVKLKSPSWRAQSFCLYSSKSEFAYSDYGSSSSSSFTFEVTSPVVMSGLTVLTNSYNVNITVQKNSLVCGTSSSGIKTNDTKQTFYPFPAPIRLDPNVQYTATVKSTNYFNNHLNYKMPQDSSLFKIISFSPNHGFISCINYDVYD